MAQLPQPAGAPFFDLSARVKLRITGADALRFLNGQITNDLRKATSDFAIQAAILSAKGKLNAVVFISVEGDSFMLDADPEVREELPARIERYIIADDVQIEDVTDRFSIFHLAGEAVPPPALPSVRTVRAARFGRSGWDIWVESAERDRVFQQLSSAFAFCDEEGAELLRIEQGIPRWGRELTDQIIPTEANLEATSIDYAKGCYIGQEVISRIKMSGQTNKRLCGLVSLSGAPLQPGMRLAAVEGKEAGWITSAAHSPRLGREIALGYVKRGFNSAGSRLQALARENSGDGIDVPVELVTVPFV
ncbi:MAG TPA: glycine cleavage T C-terminal barrel domain-containing protein [Chthoniobacterales bacterium]|nr:glycine cleavage T C-terminal barrel domain-containing protein [Chthoniobacterales bacterium]